MLQCVAVCCSVLQCVADALKCVAVRCSVLSVRCRVHYIATCNITNIFFFYEDIFSNRCQLHSHGTKQCVALDRRCVAVCCSVLQCVAVCCSVLQCVAVC